MSVTPALVDLITVTVGRFSVDVLSGWEAGLLGKERTRSGKLFDREPPKHLPDSRRQDWYAGRDAAARHRQEQRQIKKSAAPRRETVFGGMNANDAVVVIRKGWVARKAVIRQMAKDGVTGEVTVSYTENGVVKRVVSCLI